MNEHDIIFYAGIFLFVIGGIEILYFLYRDYFSKKARSNKNK